MEIVTQSTKTGILVMISGKIDTSTSAAFQEEVMKSFQKGNQVILDFEKVPYISSAGLRVLLLGHKTAASKGGSLKIIHSSDMVREVFQITGFLNVLDVE